MPKYDSNGFEIAEDSPSNTDSNGFELAPPELDNPENRSFLSNFHPMEDLQSAGRGLLDLGVGFMGMLTKSPMESAVEAGNQLATQAGVNNALQGINDPRAQSDAGFFGKQVLGAVSPVPIDPFLDALKGVGYASHLTDTPVSPDAAARGIGATAGGAALALGMGAHGDVPLNKEALPSNRLLQAPDALDYQPNITFSQRGNGAYPNRGTGLPVSPSRTFYGDAGGNPPVVSRDSFGGEQPPSKVTRSVYPSEPLPDVPMTKVVGPKGDSEFHFNPDEQAFVSKKDGKVYNTKGELISDPASDFANQVVPNQDILGNEVIRPHELDPDEIQMALDEAAAMPREATKPTNPDKEARVIKQLQQEVGATPEEAAKVRELQRAYPEESTRKLLDYVRKNPEGFERTLNAVKELEGPQFAKTAEGKLQIGVNVKRAADELTSGYNYDLNGIMVREGLQNALDAIKDSPNSGKVTIKLLDSSKDGKGIEISDNGKGMSRDEIFTVFSDLHSTGKANQAGASGGKGVGKATYMLGGKYFKARTVKEVNGKKFETTLEGSPEDLMGGNVEVKTTIVDKSTPTGTWFRTDFRNNSDTFWARGMYTKIVSHSRDIKGEIKDETFGLSDKFKSLKNDKLVTADILDDGNSNVGIYIPKDTPTRDGRSIDVHYLNNGMFQYTKSHYIPGDEVKGLPEEILVNIEPLVEEGSGDYPFPVQRESVKDSLQKAIDSLINQHIVEKKKNQGKTQLIAQWSKMVPIETNSITKSGRNTVIYDPGDRLSKGELRIFNESPIVQNLAAHIDAIIDDILTSTGRDNWANRVSTTGITLDEKLAGIHIPDPSTKGMGLGDTRSGILLNPFSAMERASPADAALDIIVTALHEIAHVGPEDKGRYVELTTNDLTDPRVGRYLQTYLKETLEQGNKDDRGHNVDFLHRMGEVYGTYGTREALDAATRIQESITDESGGYSPEIQELLRLYSERKGRANAEDDILSGTGTKSTVRRRGERDFPSDAQRVRNRAAGESVLDRRKSNLIESLNLPRALLASMDLSAPMRQGRAFIHKKQYWNAFNDMFKSLGSEKAFRAVQQSIQNHPMYRFAIDNGLSFTDLTDLSNREEAIMSSWAETGIPLQEMFNQGTTGRKVADTVRRGYQNTAGVLVRRSNAAYTAFLNKLRMDVFADLAEKNNLMSDPSQARLMADFINTATGRGSLGRFEKVATELNSVMFAPRNTASQIKMLNVFNPNHYIYQPGPVRMEAIKSLAAIFGGTSIILGLGKLAGAKVVLDPDNADFGKMKIGKTRLDFNGGYGQYVVSFARMVKWSADHLQGKKKSTYTSSMNNREYPTNPVQELGRVARNKENPVISFAHSMATGKTPTGQKFQIAPQVEQLFVPMLIQDLTTLAKRQPELLPIAAPLATFGVGVQTY